MRKVFLIGLFCVCVSAKEITLSWLDTKPRSYAKDFYILQYLKQNITPKDAINALGGAKRVNNKLFFAYAKKLGHDETDAVVECMQASGKSLVNSYNADCIELGLSAYKATKLTQVELAKAIKILQDKYPHKVKILEILQGTLPFTRLVSSQSDVFFDTFNWVGSKYREKYFNHTFPKNTLKRLATKPRFSDTIKKIVTNPLMTKAQQSLYEVDDKALDFEGRFYLGLNALSHDKKQHAMGYFESAYQKAYYKSDKDRVDFWRYKLTGDEKYLNSLARSFDVNIYSLYAHNYYKSTHPNIEFLQKPTVQKPRNYDISDPFVWLRTLSDIQKVDKKKLQKYEHIFTDSHTLGHLAFVKERYFQYKKSFFALPFLEYTQGLKADKKALLYAISRQESRFIPAALSHAYAMGMMQIMPFLSKALASQLHDVYSVYEQFDPKTNLRYASHHLEYLEAKLKHPLFVAYGYNGGIGYTLRSLEKGLFKKHSKYEPFLSMERISYDETRKYGKRVLSNYLIYQNYFNQDNQMNYDTLIQGIYWPKK